MPKRSAKQARKPPKRQTKDENQSAYDAIQQIIAKTEEEGGKHPVMQAMGRLGGLKGGKARAKKLSSERLTEIGRQGAAARWHKP